MHFNTRFLVTKKRWFGGGMDITPCLEFESDSKQFHKNLKKCATNMIHLIIKI